MTVVFIIFVFLIVVFLIGGGFFKWGNNFPANKGKMGEINIASRLSFLPKDKYIVLNDLFFKFGDCTSQIDHLVISVFGIFVIETKNYKGWIFGNSSKDHWTQNIWGNKYSFFNPIFQNESHIRFLKKNFHELNLATNYIYPIVVFINANKLFLKGNCNCIIWGDELNKFIKSFKEIVLTYEYCEQIASILISSNIHDKKLRDQHIENVFIARYYYNEKKRNRICPRCGGSLVIRNGRYGYFYGCSNYPSCHYTNEIM